MTDVTDRQLLELAAKSAGIELRGWYPSANAFEAPYVGWWNPLTDDGDALHIAVKLEMSVEISGYEASTYAYAGEAPRVHAMEMWGEDKNAATRRAIVRAAAEIGKAMP